MSEPPRAQQAPRAGEQLNWRNIIDGARFSGPVRMLASQSQVLKLEENRVQLRLNVAALATEANRRLMAQKLSDYFGRPFRVEFEVGSLDAGSTVADAQRAERAKAHAELVERFKTIRSSRKCSAFSAAPLTKTRFARFRTMSTRRTLNQEKGLLCVAWVVWAAWAD